MSNLVLKTCVPAEMNPPLAPVLVVDEPGLVRVAEFMDRVPEYCLDLETNCVEDFRERKIRTLQIGNRDEQYVIDLLALAGDKETLFDTQGTYGLNVTSRDGRHVYEALYKHVLSRLADGAKLKIGAYLNFEYTTLFWVFGIRIWNLWSVELAERVIYCGEVNFFADDFWGLEHMVGRYMHLKVDKTLQTSFGFDAPLTPGQIDYAALDVRFPIGVRTGQLRTLAKDGLMRAAQIEMDALPAFCDLHMNGARVDPERWKAIIATNEETLRKNIATLDEYFLPLVGKKGVPTVDLVGLEAKWRDLGVAGEEEKGIKERIKASQTPGAKEVLKIELAEALKRRTDLRDAARKDFYAGRRSIRDAEEMVESCEGEAAINYGSNPQLREALRKIPGLNATTLPDTNDKTLEKLAGKFPIVKALQDYRSSSKALNQYGEQWIMVGEYADPRSPDKKKLGLVHPVTGRIHAHFDQLGAETGRTSCSGPNLHNLPKEDRYRAAFVSRPGYKILTCDWSGQELRILSEYSRQESWITAFNKDWDLHLVVCEMMHEQDFINGIVHEAYTVMKEGKEKTIPPCAYIYKNAEGKDHLQCECPVHKEQRGGIKPMNFGISYGLTKWGLAPKLKVDEDVAQQRIDKYEAANPKLIAWLNSEQNKAMTTFESRTMSGRRRKYVKPSYQEALEKAQKKYKRVPSSKDAVRILKGIMSGIGREGRNTPIQGTGADMLKIAVGAGVDKNGKPFLWHLLPKYNALLINEVHDEVIIEFPEQYEAEIVPLVKDAMARAGAEFVHSMVMTSDAHVAERWWKG